MMHVGDIMSTVEGVQYRGGKNLLLFEYHGTHDIPPRYSNFKGWYPHGTEHPSRYS